MALEDWIPPCVDGGLSRSGYALLRDLEDPAYEEVIRGMEGFQAEFLARTRPLWGPEFPIPGDALSHFSRQWEFPYAWVNLGGTTGRLLDAGSGITFFPFFLATAGFEVDCCDGDASLGLEMRFDRASAATGRPVRFTCCELAELPYADAAFDAAICISVLEHTGTARTEIVAALARVLRPGGRLVLTCDVDLRREGSLLLEDVSELFAELGRSFELTSTLDLHRPGDLLTSESFLHSAPWRLPPPWRPPPGAPPGDGRADFRSIAILGATAVRRARA
jgi:SAM-dependent methyltransferase